MDKKLNRLTRLMDVTAHVTASNSDITSYDTLLLLMMKKNMISNSVDEQTDHFVRGILHIAANAGSVMTKNICTTLI